MNLHIPKVSSQGMVVSESFGVNIVSWINIQDYLQCFCFQLAPHSVINNKESATCLYFLVVMYVHIAVKVRRFLGFRANVTNKIIYIEIMYIIYLYQTNYLRELM